MRTTIKPSIDILLPDLAQPPESYYYSLIDEIKPVKPNRPQYKHEHIVVYSAQAAEVVKRGLWRHINITYSGAAEAAKRPDIGLWAVYKMLYDQIDTYRQQAHNTMAALTRAQVGFDEADQAYQAAVLPHFLLGYEARENGWPATKNLDDVLRQKHAEVMAMDDEEVADLNLRAHASANASRAFFRDELVANRTNPVANALREAIRQSRPQDQELPLTEAA